MAPLASNLRAGLLPTEIEYFATCSTQVLIIPLLNIQRIRLLDGIFGPFNPTKQSKVPLWLAVNLKGKNKCRIVMPDWLSVEALTEIYKRETTNQRFAKVPLHYIAISKVLLDVASDDIPNSSSVRSLLKDIREVRQSKILNGLEMINAEHLEMTEISSLEIAELRPFFTKAFQHLSYLSLSQNNGSIADDQDQDQDEDYDDYGGGDGEESMRNREQSQDDFGNVGDILDHSIDRDREVLVADSPPHDGSRNRNRRDASEEEPEENSMDLF